MLLQRCIFLLGLASILSLTACHPTDASLNKLDKLVAGRWEIQARYQSRIDSLLSVSPANQTDSDCFELYGQLFDLYRSFDLDSQMYYAQRRLALSSRLPEREYTQAAIMNMAEVYMRSGMYYETLQRLDEVNASGVVSVLLPYYYHLRRTTYGLSADFSITKEERKRFCSLTHDYRDSLMTVHKKGTFLYELIRADALTTEQRLDEALEVLNTYESTQPIQLGEEGIFAITKAQIYKEKGDHQAEKKELIRSAYADLSGAVREYVALTELAKMLYIEGDLDRAYRYMRCAVEDANAGSMRSRSVEISSAYPIVESAYQRQNDMRVRLLFGLIGSIAFIALILSTSLVYFAHQREKLRQSNQIKTMYVGRYMEMASLLIERFDNWRKNLHQMSKANDLKRLQAEIASQRFTQEQLTAFYHNFDDAFLTIFPDFVEDVKQLLMEGTEFRTKPGERLNTDLRVLCCIRLGITDSSQIASFLRYSLSTIYNSRTRMRNLSKCERSLFEKKVATL